MTAQTGIVYTEPIPVDTSVRETHHLHDNEENEEQVKQTGSSSFAELLAGLLQNTQPAGLNEAESDVDVFAADGLQDGIKQQEIMFDFSSGTAENVIDPEDFSGIEFSDNANERLNQNLLSAEHLLNRSLNMDDSGINSKNISRENDVLTFNPLESDVFLETGFLPEDHSLTDLSLNDVLPKEHSIAAEKIGVDSSTQLQAAAAQNINENHITDKQNHINEDRMSSAETLSRNRAREDNAVSFGRSEDDSGNSEFNSNLKGEGSLLDDFRNRLRKDRVAIEIRDHRTGENQQISGTQNSASAETGKINGQAAIKEIALDLHLPEKSLGLDLSNSQAQTVWDARAGQNGFAQNGFSSAMENMLARELHQNFNGDIVRHASIALRDGGAGTIKITLHPDNLGNVKIHLEMTENKITGHIVVESQEALNAFRREIAALEQAFRDSGYADASLNLSLTADGFGAQKQELEEGSFTRQLAAFGYEESYEQETTPVVDVFFGRRSPSVNMLA